MEKIIFTKYSNERARAFRIRTDICESEDGSRFVRKRACDPEGEAHVSRMGEWYKKLEAVYRDTPISMNRITESSDGAVFEYLEGQTLEEQLDLRLARGDADGAAEQLLRYVELVRSCGQSETFAVTDAFCAVFGEPELPDGLLCAPVTDLDMIVGNAFVTEQGWTMMDYEWSFDFPIPVNYVIFRILHFYIYGSSARKALYPMNLYGRAGLERDEVRQYERMEERFQQYVLGAHTPLRFLYPEMTPGVLELSDERVQAKVREACAAQQPAQALQLCVDSIERTEDELEIKGWVFHEKLQRPQLAAADGSGKTVEQAQLTFFMRDDVNRMFGVEDARYEAGFDLILRLDGTHTKRWGETYTLTARTDDASASYVVNLSRLAFKQGKLGQKLLRLKSGAPAAGPRYFSPYEMGLLGESRKLRREEQRFGGWRLATQLTEKELKRQREDAFETLFLFSVVIPLYNTPQKYLQAMLDSLLAQTYAAFEVCLADGSDDDRVGEFIRSRYGSEPRIRYQKLEKNGGISENTNAALAMAQGDFVVLADHDDLVTPDALYELACVLRAHPETDILYTDEDKVDMDGTHFFEPHFKPDFNRYMLRTSNYICHIFAVRRTIAEAVGGFRRAYDGAQDYDFILRCSEQAGSIRHVPKILYHWRTHEGSTAGNPESKRYAWEAGRRALEAHYARTGVQAEVSLAELFGRYRTTYRVQGQPLVSIVIPNRDHAEELARCVQSIYRKSTYRSFEVLIAENGSEDARTFHCYEELKKKYPGVRIIRWDKAFNYAAINNFAAAEAKGAYLLFLNNDTEVVTPGWIEELLGICQQPGVGAVGAKLFYPDGTIQHAGVILGLGGAAGHLFAGMAGDACGYVARANTVQNLSAVTAACMMTKRAAFDEAGGMDEALTVALNDVDYCMKLTKAGYQVVYTPYAQLTHYESATRGAEDSPQKKERFAQETQYFETKWQSELQGGDPYYNRNLSLVSGNCSLRIP